MFSIFLVSLHWLDRVLGCFGGWSAQNRLCKAVFSTHFSLCITDARTSPFIPLSRICHLQLIDIRYSGLFQSCKHSLLPFLMWSVITTALHWKHKISIATWGKTDHLRTQFHFSVFSGVSCSDWLSRLWRDRLKASQMINDYVKMPFAVQCLTEVNITN